MKLSESGRRFRRWRPLPPSDRPPHPLPWQSSPSQTCPKFGSFGRYGCHQPPGKYIDVYSFLPITRPVQIVDPMGFHLKIKLATRQNCRPDGNFALNKIRDSVKMDLLSGFKDCFFGKIGYKYGYLHCISSFHKPLKKACLKDKKSFG